MEHLFCHVWLVLFLFNLLGQRIFRFIAFFALVLSYYHDTRKGCDDDNHAQSHQLANLVHRHSSDEHHGKDRDTEEHGCG